MASDQSQYAITHDEAIQIIIDESIAILSSESKGMLGVNVIDGDMTRESVNDDSLFVYVDNAQCQQNHGIRETWTMVISLVAWVINEDVKAGQKKARQVVARAMQLLTENKRLNINFVQEVRKLTFVTRPQRAPEDASGILRCGGTIEVKYMINERGA
jgi:urease gamma subunit